MKIRIDLKRPTRERGRRGSAIYILLIMLTVLLAVPEPGGAGTIKGKLGATEEFKEYFRDVVDESLNNTDDYYWMIENGVLPILPPSIDWSSNVVVALTNTSGSPSANRLYNVTIIGAAFNPYVIIVPPKSTVKFKNEDPFVHNLYSPDLGQNFAPEILPSRQLRQVQFRNAGTYNIHCKMTPHLVGYIIVDPGVVTTVSPAKDATFLVEGIEPGKYQLKVYYKDKVVGERDVEIVDDKPVEVEVQVAPPEEEKKEEGGEKKEEQAAKPEEEKEKVKDKNGEAAEKPAKKEK
ncbi:MAG: cupredoxin domain-containing protein [Pseudomonadota bacterium]